MSEEKNVNSKQNQKLFEKYYFEYRSMIYWYILKKINNPELAEDIASDAFMKLFEHPEITNERDENGVKAWLFTVSRNLVIDHFRKKNVSKNSVDIEDDVFDIISGHEEDHLAKLIKDEQYELIIAAMEGLSGEEKEMILLRFKEDLKFDEIAEMFGKKEGSIKMKVYRALEKIKEKISLSDQDSELSLETNE